jgi:trehalose 6-phosphate synthase
MMAKLNAGTIQQWFADFIEALQDTRSAGSPILAQPPTLWPRRVTDLAARYH